MEDIVFDFDSQNLSYPLSSEHKKKAAFSANFRKRQITLDLHGCSVKEAEQRMHILFKEIPRKKGVSFLIITGKGLNSKQEKPVIKEFIKKYLSNNKVRWKIAPPKKGGSGAIIAYL